MRSCRTCFLLAAMNLRMKGDPEVSSTRRSRLWRRPAGLGAALPRYGLAVIAGAADAADASLTSSVYASPWKGSLPPLPSTNVGGTSRSHNPCPSPNPTAHLSAAANGLRLEGSIPSPPPVRDSGELPYVPLDLVMSR